MDNTNDRRLSFGQRNWLLLCILVAIISPLIVHLIRSGARKQLHKEATEVRFTDTSSKVASPPGSDTGNKAQGAPPDSLKH